MLADPIAQATNDAFARFSEAGMPMDRAWQEATRYASFAAGQSVVEGTQSAPCSTTRRSFSVIEGGKNKSEPGKATGENSDQSPDHPAPHHPDPEHPAQKTLARFTDAERRPTYQGEQLDLFD